LKYPVFQDTYYLLYQTAEHIKHFFARPITVHYYVFSENHKERPYPQAEEICGRHTGFYKFFTFSMYNFFLI